MSVGWMTHLIFINLFVYTSKRYMLKNHMNIVYLGLIIVLFNHAAMGRAWFLLCTGFIIIIIFFFCR